MEKDPFAIILSRFFWLADRKSSFHVVVCEVMGGGLLLLVPLGKEVTCRL